MTKEKKPRGRPPAPNPASALLPQVRVTPAKLQEYKQTANESGKTLSEWVRDCLDEGVIQAQRQK